jgi:hypothetical protein
VPNNAKHELSVSGVCYMNVFYICMIVCVSQKPDLRGAGRGPHFYNALCLWSGRARRKSKSFVYSKLIKLVCLESRRFPGEQNTLWSAEARKAAVSRFTGRKTLSIQWEQPNSFGSTTLFVAVFPLFCAGYQWVDKFNAFQIASTICSCAEEKCQCPHHVNGPWHFF